MKLSAILVSLIAVIAVVFVAAPTTTARSTNNLDAMTFSVDKTHSSIVFKIRHMGVSNFYGRFNDFGGEFSFDPEDLASAKFNVTVKATSIDTGNDGRDGHLRNADFFNVGDHDEISFMSTGVSKSSKEGMYELKGDLTMLGETKPVTATLEWGGTKDGGERMGTIAGFEARFTVKRSDFGMDYGVAQGGVGDEVTLIVALEGRKK